MPDYEITPLSIATTIPLFLTSVKKLNQDTFVSSVEFLVVYSYLFYYFVIFFFTRNTNFPDEHNNKAYIYYAFSPNLLSLRRLKMIYIYELMN